MDANTPSQDLQNISIRFNQLSDDVKHQFLEEQLKILNNDPQGQTNGSTAANAATSPSNAQLSPVQPSQSAIALAIKT